MSRLQLACFCLGLTLLVFSQSSGRPTSDTKLDLVVDPLRYLARGLSMWDPQAAAGQMQDQAYGYLFPMGPFFALAHGAALPAWMTQRLWESALVVGAFLGMVRLARLLRVPAFWPRVAAGLAYALAPRMLMELPVISSELLPVAALPWVLIPLVSGARHGQERRAAARSGAALLFAGGINASATLAILPVPALWLLTRSAGRRRRALLGWWTLAVALSSLWWLVPLLVLGRYSPPFLDWIESSSVTTSSTNLLAVLRGVDHWQAYLGPLIWPGGWILAAAPSVVLATSVVAAGGLVGLARRATPHRLFLGLCLLVGIVLVSAGHEASVGPLFAGRLRELLDGPLNAFRNVHKFDPVVRLPIAIGVGHAVALALDRWPATVRVPRLRAELRTRLLLVGALAAVAAVAIAPALTGRLAPSARAANDPGWWARTGQWLGAHEGAGRALVVPGAAHPVYFWGAPGDDALQPYARGPWTVRDALPLTRPGHIRLLDDIEALLATGAEQRKLGPLLARAGIRYLVVRNDLDTGRSGSTRLPFVHATIAASPGFRLAASFGPPLNAVEDPNRVTDLGLSRVTPAVQIYANAAWQDEVALLPTAGTVAANGSGDNVSELLAAGLPATTPIVFGRDGAALQRAGVTTRPVLTDGIRRREFGFGGISAYSPTLTAGQPFSVPRATHDYLPADAGALTTAHYSGIAGVRASTSAATPTSFLYKGAAYSPWAALDGDPSTSWFSSALRGGVGQWIAVDLPEPVSVDHVRLQFAADQPAYPTRVRVTTDVGSLVTDVSPSDVAQDVPVPPGSTQSIRLTVLDMTGRAQVAVASLTVPGVVATRTLSIPGVSSPQALVFRAERGHRAACLSVQRAAACNPDWAAVGEEDAGWGRTFRLGSPGTYVLTAGVRLADNASLNRLLDGDNPVQAIASSVNSTDPRERAGAAVDGDPTTGWVGSPKDRQPTLKVTLPRRAQVDGLRMTPATGAPAARPSRVLVRAGSERFELSVPDSGVVTFPHPVRTATVALTVLESRLLVNRDSESGALELRPVGIGELRLLGPDVPAAHTPTVITLDCGAGLGIDVDGRFVPLRATVSAADLLVGRPVPATACGGPVGLTAGTNQLVARTDAVSSVNSITLQRTGTSLADAAPPAGVADVRTWHSTERTVRVSTTADALLVVRENANAGWRATLDGRELAAVTVDGWQQGWLVPAGADGLVHLEFRAQRVVDWGLVAGLLAAIVLVVGAVLRPRRPATAPPLRDARPRRAVVSSVLLAGLLLAGGFAGLALGAAVVAAAAVVRPRRWRTVPPAVAGAAVALAGALEALRPAGSADSWAGATGLQLLCLLGLAATVLGLPAGRRRLAASRGRPSSGPPRPGEPAQQRALEHVPRQRGGGGRTGGGEQEQRDEVSAEQPPVQPPGEGDQQR